MPFLIRGYDYVGDVDHCVAITDLYKALVTTSPTLDSLGRGELFFYGSFSTLANAATLDFTLETPALPPTVTLFFDLSASVETTIEVYEGATVGAGGTVITMIDANRVTSNTAVTVVKEDPTITDVGTLITDSKLGYSGKGNDTFGATGGGGIMLAPSTSYLIRITALAADDELDYSLNIIEAAARTLVCS